MSDSVVKTFDLYNTTFYWNGYTMPEYETELNVARAYYTAQYSSNPLGSQIDFFAELANEYNQNPVFTLSGTTIENLSYLWAKYWWEEAMYYSSTVVLSAITTKYPEYYQSFSESVGSLYYLSRFNNLQNTETIPYSTVIDSLLPPGLSDSIQTFYSEANSLFIDNLQAIGDDGVNLLMADADLTRRIASNVSLSATVNNLYPILYKFLPYNTSVIGNYFTPYNWYVQMPYEDFNTILARTISVDQTNTTISTQTQLSVSALKV
jgi:hypothetical protein